MQKVVRTYPNHIRGMDDLSKSLRQGYYVILCNEIKSENGSSILEYILEESSDDDENDEKIATKQILYLCDRNKCDNSCPSPGECSHTLDINHAKNFDHCGDFYMEVDPVTKVKYKNCEDETKKEEIEYPECMDCKYMIYNDEEKKYFCRRTYVTYTETYPEFSVCDRFERI